MQFNMQCKQAVLKQTSTNTVNLFNSGAFIPNNVNMFADWNAGRWSDVGLDSWAETDLSKFEESLPACWPHPVLGEDLSILGNEEGRPDEEKYKHIFKTLLSKNTEKDMYSDTWWSIVLLKVWGPYTISRWHQCVPSDKANWRTWNYNEGESTFSLSLHITNNFKLQGAMINPGGANCVSSTSQLIPSYSQPVIQDRLLSTLSCGGKQTVNIVLIVKHCMWRKHLGTQDNHHVPSKLTQVLVFICLKANPFKKSQGAPLSPSLRSKETVIKSLWTLAAIN